MIRLTNPAQKIDQMESKNKDMGLSYIIQEKVINNLCKVGLDYFNCKSS